MVFSIIKPHKPLVPSGIALLAAVCLIVVAMQVTTQETIEVLTWFIFNFYKGLS
jgi:hypothetical protein